MTNYYPPNEYIDHEQNNTGMTKQTPAIKVQSSPNRSEIDNLGIALRSKTSYVTCPYCRNSGLTRTDVKCNIVDSIFCFVTIGTIWGLTHIFRGKDLNCSNAEHFCNKCNVQLGQYFAC